MERGFFTIMVGIDDANGPQSLLENMESVEAPDDTTVVFKLAAEYDQTWPQILSSPAAAILDEDVFPADKLLDDAAVVKEQPFAGQYKLTKFDKGNLAAFTANDAYQGMWGKAKTESINVKYYANESNLSQAIETKAVDVAFRSLSATDIEKFEGTDGLQVIHGPGGEIRYIVFNFDTMPYGAKTPEADAAKATAVR